MSAPGLIRSVDVLDGFTVPTELAATLPPEQRGLMRDEVRLMVSDDRGIRHHRFRDLDGELRRGDLLVVNSSANLLQRFDRPA